MSDTEPSQQTTALAIDQALRQAIFHQKAGYFEDAENLYLAILQVQPNHPDANHNLGVLAVQKKQPAAGLPYFVAALNADPAHGQYWLSYIDALFQAGQSEQARQVLALARQQGLQGVEVDFLVKRLGDTAQTADQPAIEKPLPASSAAPQNSTSKTKPNNPDKSAKKSVPKQVKTPRPKEIDTLVTLFNKGRYMEAATCARKMTERYPLHGFGWKALGAAYRQMGQVTDALAPLQKAATLSPNDAEAHSNLGITLKDLGKLNEAEASCRRALQIKPDHTEAHLNLGLILDSLGRLDEAEASLRRALQIDPGCSEALHGLGYLFKEKGQVAEAKDSHLQALKVKPDNLKIRYSLALTDKVAAEDANFAELVKTATAVQNGETLLSDEQMILLHFALGKCYDDIDDYQSAFPHFLEGCKLKRATFNYRSDNFTQQTSAIMRVFDQATIDRLHGAGNSSALPIFILGMPRSGTTLIEQIIASHPDVYGAGELPDLMRIAQQNSAGVTAAFPDNLHFIDQTTLNEWGAEYLAGLKQHALGALHITDKMPGNFLALGLIHLMLPNAKIIHVNRNPVDTCLSCFTQLFTETAQQYSYDLTELGRYYVDYSRLMEHWRSVLPANAFLDVNYEDIVADQESQARRMLEYCELEWNDACIEFHNNKRGVRTASAVQVRQPIYQSSVGRWRNYQKFLGPLLNALGDLAPEN